MQIYNTKQRRNRISTLKTALQWRINTAQCTLLNSAQSANITVTHKSVRVYIFCNLTTEWGVDLCLEPRLLSGNGLFKIIKTFVNNLKTVIRTSKRRHACTFTTCHSITSWWSLLRDSLQSCRLSRQQFGLQLLLKLCVGDRGNKNTFWLPVSKWHYLS